MKKIKEITDEWQGFTAAEEKVILSDKEFMDGLNSDGVSDDTINRLMQQLGYGILYGDEDELFNNAIVGLAMRETCIDWRWCEGIEPCDDED